MMNRAYCPECKKHVEIKVEKNLVREYKGVQVNVEEHVPHCSECDTELFVPDIENENLKRLYQRYRELTGLITPEEIQKIREKYGLSQRELGQILGWGKMTINRYERGALPSKSHSDILKLILTSEGFFKEKVEEAFKSGRITERTYQKTMEKIRDSLADLKKKIISAELEHPEDIYNGFRRFDFEKLENLISYIAEKVENLYLSSLNKFLWYIDFMHFKRCLRSITGLRYIKYAYGPVIEKFAYKEIAAYPSDKYTIEEYETPDGAIQTKIKSKGNYDLSVFTQEELQTINMVIDALKDKTCSAISELSHKEVGWQQTPLRELISYEYAKTVSLDSQALQK
ncbi:type II TA system antitoxin MqsA family protein [Caldicellulosiruptor sp. DIB 104C]|uniref:type II TA system antitoxin MqsA family protein n=2 Tax=unclassified Caldicellulosiruptor TaxID=2622462 RepID=UPI00039BB4EE|nr:type II TA system antitoxin MqsA family protein [Caldicellulosiruptor sp. DIB 104C]